MSRSIVLGLTVLLGGLAVLGLWLVRAERRTDTGASVGAAEPAGTVEQPVAELVPAPIVAADPRAEETREPAGSPRKPAASERPTITGMVLVPGGIPAGEKLVVTAESFASGRGAREAGWRSSTAVAADGKFTLHLLPDVVSVWLGLESSSFYLPEPVAAAAGHRDVVLRAERLATLAGRVLPPPGVAFPSDEFDWGDVQIKCTRTDGSWVVDLSPAQGGTAALTPGPDGTFATPCLPVGVELVLSVTHPLGPPWESRIAPLASGEHRSVVVALDAGVRISGSVIDEHGAPVVGEALNASLELGLADGAGSMPAKAGGVQTDARGCFELARLTRARWRVSTASFGFARGAEATVDATVGDVTGLVLAVVRGASIEGTVSWPDGRPVESFAVTARGRGRGVHARGTAGSFRLSGLSGWFDLELCASDAGYLGKLALPGVPAGGAPLDLVLELAPTFELRGDVVDSANLPVREFTVTCSKASPPTRFAMEGKFVLTELPAGELEVAVHARGFQWSKQQVIVGPGLVPALRFVLAPAGTIRGRVVDPRGKPVPTASIDNNVDARQIGTAVEASGFGWATTWSKSDGTFEVSPTSSRVWLVARRSGYSPSVPVMLELAPGEVREGVELRLRAPSRIEGRLVDAGGLPVAHIRVLVHSADSSSHFPDPSESNQSTTTDARGEFVLEGLPGGEVELEAFREPPGKGHARAEVVLEMGGTTKIELRFE